ncbi:LamG domain-containing protein [Microvirga antarctica]|uniref:LamG domain-containing protein n=1 Tax=Microvirga antarctica TaxID=2819233 RepID=UPI001B30B602|nr:LamG domain-containing protein [Microvirga antarctica]
MPHPPAPPIDKIPLASPYDKAVLADQPTLYLPLSKAGLCTQETDLAQPGRTGIFHSGVSATTMPNGDHAARFDGAESYVEVADGPDLSVPKTGILTVEAWLRPDALVFPKDEGSGYVHWMGKGELAREDGADQMEWAARLYGADNTDQPYRENRLSGYAFNMEGGRGIGSYTQEPVKAGAWMHFVFVINTTPEDPSDSGYTRIYRDGVNTTRANPKGTPWDDMDPLAESWPDPSSTHRVEPGDGNAPLRIGTRDFRSFFDGAIGKVAIYDHELTPTQIQHHYDGMMGL